MNKKTILPVSLVALPVVAMMTAFFPKAVRYVYPDGKTVYATYFDLLEEVGTAVWLPAAVIAIGICLFFAVAYVFSHKPYWLKAVSGPSFAAALLAVVPYLTQGEIRAFPNVLVPIAMMLEWFIAHQLGKTADSAPIAREKGRRLTR